MCAISDILAELNVLPSASIEYLHAVYWLPNTPQPAVVLYGTHGIISIQVPNSTYYTAACANYITLSPVCVAQYVLFSAPLPLLSSSLFFLPKGGPNPARRMAMNTSRSASTRRLWPPTLLVSRRSVGTQPSLPSSTPTGPQLSSI